MNRQIIGPFRTLSLRPRNLAPRRHPTAPQRNGIRHASETSSPTPGTKRISRFQALNDKLPPFLRTYTRPLLSAPVSHVTSFLVLHEITALVPLIGLATAFHYANWLPESVVQGKWVQEGVEKWGRYFRRKGWVEDSSSSSSSSSEPVKGSVVGEDELAEKQGNVQDVMMNRGAGWRVVLEVATAWAVVKALLPVRIMACVWATPWFARVGVIPIMGLVRRLAGRSKIP